MRHTPEDGRSARLERADGAPGLTIGRLDEAAGPQRRLLIDIRSRQKAESCKRRQRNCNPVLNGRSQEVEVAKQPSEHICLPPRRQNAYRGPSIGRCICCIEVFPDCPDAAEPPRYLRRLCATRRRRGLPTQHNLAGT